MRMFHTGGSSLGCQSEPGSFPCSRLAGKHTKRHDSPTHQIFVLPIFGEIFANTSFKDASGSLRNGWYASSLYGFLALALIIIDGPDEFLWCHVAGSCQGIIIWYIFLLLSAALVVC
ncbi:uncharacterized protein BDZ83DRAFT_644032 [Colletotrichum acutatum]|uniref:Uncharacterized protein n=1 Tax=Glomerella acutata TaxID=27357 RepID=A0AAD8X7V7_GLOAC|nr:uncharacterized protein BDZ83DRAFT_644032 [Colletotrichum acutatum]KAK1705645.1 hypothetical protein BDZ83DRAFT_644032 [Colletotrichum acutatum]